MRYTIKDTAAAVGLSVSQTRRRIDTISADLAGDLHRGSRGAILLTDRGLALLRRAVDLERERGVTCNDAVKIVQEETQKPDQKRGPDPVTVCEGLAGELIKDLRERIQDQQERIRGLEDDRDHWRGLALQLQLPAPRRRWLSLFRAGL